jgi:MFS family permease
VVATVARLAADSAPVQYAGNKNPFLVTVILASVQLLSMLVTSALTDSVGRRPLTVYPYAVTVVSVLCLGIVGCFDYTAKATSSLLVRCFRIMNGSVCDILTSGYRSSLLA